MRRQLWCWFGKSGVPRVLNVRVLEVAFVFKGKLGFGLLQRRPRQFLKCCFSGVPGKPNGDRSPCWEAVLFEVAESSYSSKFSCMFRGGIQWGQKPRHPRVCKIGLPSKATPVSRIPANRRLTHGAAGCGLGAAFPPEKDAETNGVPAQDSSCAARLSCWAPSCWL